MPSDNPLLISRALLAAMGTRLFFYYQDRVPQDTAIVVVSNHRSFMDAPMLMAALEKPVRFASHHYMGQVPVMRDVVSQLGCFPLAAPENRSQAFFEQATQLLQSRQLVGVFPEGGQPMVSKSLPCKVGKFHRGFAHLALKSSVQNLAVLPVAIASTKEFVNAGIPLRLLQAIDPSEPLFDQSGWHPMVVYRRANILIGHPFWVTEQHREKYQGKQAKSVVSEITDICHGEIQKLLHYGCR
ncbi:MAG: 1-acyl-sn-glycerol-3-phosphate acyltransferase [Kastovskya adunca ATA6-11-RM4]|jgi:1-acyl-sn-glycerol-3-phosphate acyltransferase|nr:1-acyl-sn-glycerol-3-phosphate acyltransferase [Kastovskya adunca ATA6-11-RM4]